MFTNHFYGNDVYQIYLYSSVYSSTYENIYCFHHTYEMYAKLTAATIVRITRQPPKRGEALWGGGYSHVI